MWGVRRPAAGEQQLQHQESSGPTGDLKLQQYESQVLGSCGQTSSYSTRSLQVPQETWNYSSTSLRFLVPSERDQQLQQQKSSGPVRRLEDTAVGVSGSWLLRRQTSSYNNRSLQVPARRLEATAVGVSGSGLLRRESSSNSNRSLQGPVRRLEDTAVGVQVPGPCYKRPGVTAAGTLGSWFMRQ